MKTIDWSDSHKLEWRGIQMFQRTEVIVPPVVDTPQFADTLVFHGSIRSKSASSSERSTCFDHLQYTYVREYAWKVYNHRRWVLRDFTTPCQYPATGVFTKLRGVMTA